MHGEPPFTRNQLEAVLPVKARASEKRTGIDYAVAKGWIVEAAGARNARVYVIGDIEDAP